jgi:hypothetical protein
MDELDQTDRGVAELRRRLRIKKMPKPLTFCKLTGREVSVCDCADHGGKQKSQEQMVREWAAIHGDQQSHKMGGSAHKKGANQ